MSDTIPPTVQDTVTPTVPTEAVEPTEDELLIASGLLKPDESEPVVEVPVEEPAAEPADEAPAAVEPETAPVAEVVQPQQPAPVVEDVAGQRDAQIAQINSKLAALDAIPEADRDVYDYNSQITRLLVQKDRLVDAERVEMKQATAAALEYRQEQEFWAGWEKDNGVEAKRGKEIWTEEATKAQKKYGNDWKGAAIVNMETRVKLIKVKQTIKPTPTVPAKPGPTITPGGGSIVPSGVVPRPSVSNDPEDDFVNNYKGQVKAFARG
jgi:hypothetical protein